MQKQHSFAQVPPPNMQRSVFDRSHEHKTTFDAGYLIPFYCDEALPGDTFSGSLSVFARLATPIKPIMDNLYMDFHFFAIPERLLWDNWPEFNGEREDPVADYETDVPYTMPYIDSPAGGFLGGSLADYMGIPTKVDTSVRASWFRGYNLVWNTWYRDQNLQDHAPVAKGDSGDVVTDYILRRRSKRHDYFTSCLPWPQKGPGVDVPIGTRAPVYGTGIGLPLIDDLSPTYHGYGLVGDSTGINNHLEMRYGAWNDQVGFSGGSVGSYVTNKIIGVATQDQMNNVGNTDGAGLYADLSSATAATINELRQAFQLQHMFERDARGGTRYTEIIRSHFGVISPDARLQRPEFLGGGTIRININPVQQTATGATPLGNLAAYGTASSSGMRIGFSRSFTEHVILLGLVSVRADLTYQQGLNKMWMRRTREDFYWPSFAHLGEQPVYNTEIYATGTIADATVFGYQERYAEYRYKPSLVTGLFRHNATGTLDSWHLSQVLDSTYPTAGDAPPALNEDFITENPPIDRVIAVPSEPHIIMDTHFNLRCARPMPVYSVPGLIDHF